VLLLSSFGVQSSFGVPTSDEGFEVYYKTGTSRVLVSRGDLVWTIIPEGQIFRADFLVFRLF
jgi:hypothetical protein